MTIVVTFFLLLTRFVNVDAQDHPQGLEIVGSRVVQTSSEHWGPDLNSDAPEIEFKDTDGKNRTITDLRGNKEGLLMFFCVQVSNHRDVLLADMQEHIEQFADEGFAIVAVTAEEVEENMEHKKALKLEYPLLSDHNLEGAQKFDIVVLNPQKEKTIKPGVVLIDADNKVIFRQQFDTLIIHSDHSDGSYSNHYVHEPSVKEILQSLPKLPTESTLEKDSAIED